MYNEFCNLYVLSSRNLASLMLGGGRACEGPVVDNLRNARRVMGVRLGVPVETVRAVVESLPLLEVGVAALPVDVEVHPEAKERLGAFEVVEIALRVLVFQGTKRWVFRRLRFRVY
jgi:hypothetical protein